MRKKYTNIDKIQSSFRNNGFLNEKIQTFKKRKWSKTINSNVNNRIDSTNLRKKSLYPTHLNYKQRLSAKQMFRAIYGFMNDQQLKNIFIQAKRSQRLTNLAVLQKLETRLDILVYRAGFATSLFEARQYINHGYFLVNSKQVFDKNISLSVGDTFCVDNKYKKTFLTALIKKAKEDSLLYKKPTYIEIDYRNLRGLLVELPDFSSIYFTNQVDILSTELFYTRG
jgi:ribosomal protein S4